MSGLGTVLKRVSIVIMRPVQRVIVRKACFAIGPTLQIIGAELVVGLVKQMRIANQERSATINQVSGLV